MSSLNSDSSRDEEAASAAQHANCWGDMQSDSVRSGDSGWADLASRRPAVQERLTRLVQTLELDIIPRLVRAHPQSGVTSAPGRDGYQPGPTDVERFTADVMSRDDVAIHTTLATWRARGTSVETLFVDLLAPAARHLGKLWDDDRCHFADVTVGLGRLQQIMRGLSSAFGTEVEPPVGGRRALLMPAPGDQHTFGLSMVSEFFARAGWEVVGMIAPAPKQVQDKVHSEWFDLVGFSAGSSTRMDGLQSCIAGVRRHSHNRSVAVMVGGPLFALQPDLAATLGADGTCSDARLAPAAAEAMLARRVKGA